VISNWLIGDWLFRMRNTCFNQKQSANLRFFNDELK